MLPIEVQLWLERAWTPGSEMQSPCDGPANWTSHCIKMYLYHLYIAKHVGLSQVKLVFVGVYFAATRPSCIVVPIQISPCQLAQETGLMRKALYHYIFIIIIITITIFLKVADTVLLSPSYVPPLRTVLEVPLDA